MKEDAQSRILKNEGFYDNVENIDGMAKKKEKTGIQSLTPL